MAWRDQMAALAVLCLLLPVLSFVTTGDHLAAYLQEGDWESAGVEIFSLAVGVAAAAAWAWMRRAESFKAVRKQKPAETSQNLAVAVDPGAVRKESLP
jgi:hypothetical protein